MLKLLLALIITIVLTGCSKEEDISYAHNLGYYNVPLTANVAVKTPYSLDAKLYETDGISKWKWDDGSRIEVYGSTATYGSKVTENIYKNKECIEYVDSEYSVVVYGCEEYLNDVLTYWQGCDPVIQYEPKWPKSKRSMTYPAYAIDSFVVTERGLAVPNHPKPTFNDFYTADIWNTNDSYIYGFVKYCFVEEARVEVYTRLNTYGVREFDWLETDDFIVAWNDATCVGAVKQTSNKYLIVGSNTRMKDFVYYNVDKHNKERLSKGL